MNTKARIVVIDDEWRKSNRNEVYNKLLKPLNPIIIPVVTHAARSISKGGLITTIDDIARMQPAVIVTDLDILHDGNPQLGVGQIGRMLGNDALACVPIIVVSDYIDNPLISKALKGQGIIKERQFSWPCLRDNENDEQEQFDWSVRNALKISGFGPT